MQNGPRQYHDVKNFVETKRAWYGVRPLECINYSSDTIGNAAAEYEEK